jgi:hypothetical protein
MYIGIHVKLLLFLSDFNDTWVFLTDFQQNTIIELHENPSSGSWDVPCWHTDRHDIANSCFLKFCESDQKSLSYNLTTEGSHSYMLLQTW